MNLGVFSLWTGTPDFKLTRGLALIYSAAIAYGAQAFHEIELVTDHNGIQIADRLGWQCKSYSLALQNFCPEFARHVWMLGKLRAQQIQTKPFVHVDLDFLIFRTLPARVTRGPVCAQSKDHPNSYANPYVRKIIEYVGLSPDTMPYNLGIVGWNDMTFCKDYCRRAWELCLKAGKKFHHGGCVSIVCEQLLIGEMARNRSIKVETAIPLPLHTTLADLQDVEFVHLWGESKHDPDWQRRVEERFEEDLPEAYRRFCMGWGMLQRFHAKPAPTPVYGYTPEKPINSGPPPVLGKYL